MAAEFPPEAYIGVTFRMLLPEEGGRRNGLFTGSSRNCWIGNLDEDGRPAHNSAALLLSDRNRVEPGEVVAARLRPARREFWSAVAVGDSIDVCEGSKVIGVAEVVEIFPY
ncbi:MAG: hypothetical protein ABMA25_22580 [Ilumatobacteraceae bacterium]